MDRSLASIAWLAFGIKKRAPWKCGRRGCQMTRRPLRNASR